MIEELVEPDTYYVRVESQGSANLGTYTIHASATAVRTVFIEPSSVPIARNMSQTLTVQLHPARPLPADASISLSKSGFNAGALTVPATVTISAGMSSATFDVRLGTGSINVLTVSVSDATFVSGGSDTFTAANGLPYTLSVDDESTLVVGNQPPDTVYICNRTDEVEAAILFGAGADADDCADVPLEYLEDVTELRFFRDDLFEVTALRSDDFSNLPMLAELLLLNNSLTLLPAGLFNDLPLLLTLEVTDNDLTSLPPGLFAGQSTLQSLQLDQNNLMSLPAELFGGLSNLQRLDLGQNNLFSLDAGLFNGLSLLSTLRLDNNDLASLDADLFNGLSILSRLELHDNELTTLPAGIFDDVLDTLRDLTLDDELQVTVSFGAPSAQVLVRGVTRPLTVRLSTASSVSLRLLIDADGEGAQNAVFPGTITIHAGMVSTNFDITIAPGATVARPVNVRFSDPRPIYPSDGGMMQVNMRDNVRRDLVSPTTEQTRIFFVNEQPSGTANICSRTDEVEAAILASPSVTETDCALVPLFQLSSITRLDLQGEIASTTTLADNDFDNLSGLLDLNLSSNNLVALPAGLFGDLAELRTLNLSDNNLDSLPAGLFDDLAELRTLNLSDNNLDSLPAGLFGDLAELRTLNLSDNNLDSLPAELFGNPSILQTLDLSDNNLATVPENVFAGLSELTFLSMRRQALSTMQTLSLPARLFDGLDGLESLHLDDNPRLTNFVPGLFDDVLDTLDFLRFDDELSAKLSIEPGVAFIAPGSTAQSLTARLSTTSPVSLRLVITKAGNAAGNITLPTEVTIPAGMRSASFNIPLAQAATIGTGGRIRLGNPAFYVTTDTAVVQIINIRNGVVRNRLVVPDSASDTFTFVVGTGSDASRLVNICGRTDEVEAAILASPNVTETDCMVVPFIQLATITELNLARVITDTTTTLGSDDFADLISLQVLNLLGNKLGPLPTGLFAGRSNLQSLDLRDNDLESLPAGLFTSLSNLQRLDLRNNDLESLPAGLFTGLSDLRRLELRSNKLESLPAGLFNDLGSLLYLNLGYNDLASLDAGLFDSLSDLEVLGLIFNDLESLPDNLFDNLFSLRALNLSYNRLDSLDAELFDQLSDLQALHLFSNRLEPPLPSGLFDGVLDTLTTLMLDGDLRAGVSIQPSTGTVGLGRVQRLTAELANPSPVELRLDIIAGGETSRITLPDPATVTIPAGMMRSSPFRVTLDEEATIGNTNTVRLANPKVFYPDSAGTMQENDVPTVVASLVNLLDSTFTFTVIESPDDGVRVRVRVFLEGPLR